VFIFHTESRRAYRRGLIPQTQTLTLNSKPLTFNMIFIVVPRSIVGSGIEDRMAGPSLRLCLSMASLDALEHPAPSGQ
jgi:hypothetical protein